MPEPACQSLVWLPDAPHGLGPEWAVKLEYEHPCGAAVYGTTPLGKALCQRHFYDHYIHSPRWERKKNERARATGYACEQCDDWIGPRRAKSDLHLHHLTYERLGDEPDEDLVLLCRDCHRRAHGRQ